MKKFSKLRRAKKESQDEPAARITNETVAEHREKVLAGGRKFKYPLQYQKHKLVVNTMILGVATVALLTIFCWQQLYVAQSSSKLMYRITQLLPVSAANVDGESVRYSDYLMRYRSSLFYAQKHDFIDLNSHGGQCQAAYYQRQQLVNAESAAYVTKLARGLRLAVSDKEVDEFIQRDVDARSVSLNAYEKTVLNSYYDWSLDEYKGAVRGELLKRKVSFAVDSEAKKRANDILQAVKGGADFASVAKTSSDDDMTKINGGDGGVLPVANLDSNGLVSTSLKMEPNQISDLIQGVGGYYIIQLISKDKDNVHYRLIKVGLTGLDKQFESLVKDNKVKEYIKVDRSDCQQSSTGDE